MTGHCCARVPVGEAKEVQVVYVSNRDRWKVRLIERGVPVHLFGDADSVVFARAILEFALRAFTPLPQQEKTHDE